MNSDQERVAFCTAMGNPDWTMEGRFASHTARRDHHDELDVLIEANTIIYDNVELFHILRAKGVPAGPVQYEGDTYHDQHLNAREFFQTTFHEDIGTYRYPGFLWKISEIPGKVSSAPAVWGNTTIVFLKKY